MNTFGPPQLVLTRGKGARVWDDEGREYVDLLGGIAVNSLGHAHPAVVEAVTRQLSTLGHISNFFASEPQITLAERLLGHLGPPRAEEAAHQGPDPAVGKVFFTNSGAEANEAALKLTRRTGRTRVVAAEGSFHGRTMGALSLTAKAAYREPFEPLPGEVTFVPYGDSVALAAAVTDQTAARVRGPTPGGAPAARAGGVTAERAPGVPEPIQGEAGVVEPPPGYLADARRVTRDHGALLWLDEVQTGIGRTGSWLCAAADPEVAPDVVTLAKGLGGGLPIGACIGVGPVGDLLQPGHHGTTFGGNPVACAAALAVLDTIVDEGLLDRARAVGARLRAGVAAHPQVTDVRGRGLLIGIDVA